MTDIFRKFDVESIVDVLPVTAARSEPSIHHGDRRCCFEQVLSVITTRSYSAGEPVCNGGGRGRVS